MTARSIAAPVLPAVVAAMAAAAVGWAVAVTAGAGSAARMLPWVLGRGLGIAGYLALVVLTGFGLWLRHPWRTRWRHPTPDAALRIHAWLAAAALALVAGHIVALVADPYAGVGAAGAVVPGRSSYRPFAVGLGTVSVYLGLLVGTTAALAGRIGRVWRAVHYAASLVLGLAVSHALLAGSDTGRLRLVYLGTGAVLVALAVTRRLVRAPTVQPGGAG